MVMAKSLLTKMEEKCQQTHFPFATYCRIKPTHGHLWKKDVFDPWVFIYNCDMENENILDFKNALSNDLLKQVKIMNKRLNDLNANMDYIAGAIGALVDHFVPIEDEDPESV